MSLMLNMIARNESARIERALASAAPFISSWVIVDTGSTDDTKDRVKKFFDDAAIPGQIFDAEFRDFGQARNDALRYARALVPSFRPDFFLLMDADMELVVKDNAKFLERRSGSAYEMYQHAGTMHYTNSRLLNAIVHGDYKGPTHEYLDVPSSGCIPEDVAYFVDHADGANRPDKFKRDIRLLKHAMEQEPNNERYMYYLAASYRDAGQYGQAAKWFRKRIEAGGWDQEVWQSEVMLAHSLKELGHRQAFVATLMDAYARRPGRAEAMYDLARWYREQPDKQAAALACAEAVEHLTSTTDNLFVSDYVYKVGIKEEISIAAGYVPGKADKGRRITDELAIKTTPYWSARASARANTFWYLRPLGELCPSFRWQQIPFTPPDGLVAMNPSVTVHLHKIFVNVRAVNYRIDNDGRYIITATDGTANAENPIDTRNFILNLGFDPMTSEPIGTHECYRPGNMACEFPLVTGFEDVRLFSVNFNLYGSATVRQMAADGQCEQVLSRIERQGCIQNFKPDDSVLHPDDPRRMDENAYYHRDIVRMLREPRETEKNWAPFCWDVKEPLFMWRPGVVVNTAGKKIVDNPPPFEIDNISGSSQLITWGTGSDWLAVVHTAHSLPNESYKRYYFHRFIEYGFDMRVKRMSLPFVFHDRAIEFCAGICRVPNQPGTLALSYGYKDCEARIGTVSEVEVDRLLEQGHVYG